MLVIGELTGGCSPVVWSRYEEFADIAEWRKHFEDRDLGTLVPEPSMNVPADHTKKVSAAKVFRFVSKKKGEGEEDRFFAVEEPV